MTCETERYARQRRLAVAEGGIREGIDLLDVRIRHGIASGGDTVAMDHQCRASAAVGLVIGIWIAEVKGEMIVTVRIHLSGVTT